MVTGGGPRGEEDKDAEKRFLFIKVEVTGGCLVSFGHGGWEVGAWWDPLRVAPRALQPGEERAGQTREKIKLWGGWWRSLMAVTSTQPGAVMHAGLR